MSESPYSSPPIEAPPRRSRVRGVLAGIIGFMGAATAAGNAALLWHRIFAQNMIPWHAVPWRFAIWEVELRVVEMLIGAVWVFSGLLIWRGSWRAGLSLAIINCVFMIASPEVNHELRREFAGDRYTIEIPDGRGGTETAVVLVP
jgi:hypothetical protein